MLTRTTPPPIQAMSGSVTVGDESTSGSALGRIIARVAIAAGASAAVAFELDVKGKSTVSADRLCARILKPEAASWLFWDFGKSDGRVSLGRRARRRGRGNARTSGRGLERGTPGNGSGVARTVAMFKTRARADFSTRARHPPPRWFS